MVVPVQLLVLIGERGVVLVDLSSGTEGLTLISLLFLRSSPVEVRTTYDLGVPADRTVLPGML